MSNITKISYIIAIITFFLYFFIKYKKRNYVLSPLNISVFTSSFTTLFMPIIFYKYNEAWYALGINNAQSMWRWLNISLFINSIGYSVRLVVLIYVEFYRKKHNYIINKFIRIVRRNINASMLDIVFWVVIFIWYYIVFTIGRGLPILNNNRTFYLDTSISFIYQALNEIILLCTLYYGLTIVIRGKKHTYFAVAAITILLQGNRSKILVNTILPIIVWKVFTFKYNYEYSILRKKIKKISRKVLFVLPIIAIIGILLGLFRSNKNINISSIINSFFFGNTFSDIRDGAFLLRAFQKRNIGYLFGKTYFAALISFLPSSVSKFRYTWSWGKFSTGLVGYTHHLGFRGGGVIESYFNFGYIGIIIFSIFWGFLMGYLENYFYEQIYLSKAKKNAKDYFVIFPILNIVSSLTVSFSISLFYVDILFVFGIIFLSALSKNITHISYK